MSNGAFVEHQTSENKENNGCRQRGKSCSWKESNDKRSLSSDRLWTIKTWLWSNWERRRNNRW